MKTPVKATLVTIAVVVVLAMAALIYVLINQSQTAPPSSGDSPSSAQLVRQNSHVLDDGGEGAVTVVEFLDFECEACGSFYPIVEDLREQFAGEITYVIRYFPLPGHFNSKNAAIAAEAAAQQDRFEDMYHRLFETQAEWGEAQESRADLFRGFAEELGLDMAAYDAAVADPSTTARVNLDFEEGRALGVSSTPTFFVNGELAELQEWDDLENLIQAAVSGGQ
ncbi:thioredoxin domain-containing protein [Microbacterium luteum]|uniref:DsbA family protein n=1 Tax=Microbacterium TaxID=33882 RepID=UPI0018879D10|nr:thioredoxin domain-containing protein [Microbacterium luteum]|tara:strand:- start:520 stop:1188 length:669 start_codon:yes stop_codon:yes gene_type:complete